MSTLFKNPAKGQMALQREQMAKTDARLAEEERRVAAVEEGLRRVRKGGRGMLAYVDREMSTSLGGRS